MFLARQLLNCLGFNQFSAESYLSLSINLKVEKKKITLDCSKFMGIPGTCISDPRVRKHMLMLFPEVPEVLCNDDARGSVLHGNTFLLFFRRECVRTH